MKDCFENNGQNTYGSFITVQGGTLHFKSTKKPIKGTPLGPGGKLSILWTEIQLEASSYCTVGPSTWTHM